MKLQEYGELLAYEIAFWMQGLADPQYPLAEMGNLSIQLSKKFRALAIMSLVANGDTDLFYHNLIRSGRVREKYLRRLLENGIVHGHHQASGRYEPILDAIAAGDVQTARHIISLSPTDWREHQEYKDDYFYAQILHGLVLGEQPQTHLISLVQEFEMFLHGEPSVRLEVSRALINEDEIAFDEAFQMLLEERGTQIAADKQRGQMEDPEVIAERRVFVEGLALLRLAGARELRTETEYPYCPSLARVPMRTPFPGE